MLLFLRHRMLLIGLQKRTVPLPVLLLPLLLPPVLSNPLPADPLQPIRTHLADRGSQLYGANPMLEA